MKLSISNIAWTSNHDDEMYAIMANLGYSGIEIAPSRLFGKTPYKELHAASVWAKELKMKYGLEVSSMQSIWFGRNENIFRSQEERQTLADYTFEALKFAECVGCKNLVFGCPRNRNIEGSAEFDKDSANEFFEKIGEKAAAHGVKIALEANPVIYNTNFLNTNQEILVLFKKLRTIGLGINLDLGAMIYNQENVKSIKEMIPLINHVHISEPYLNKIERRSEHKALADCLAAAGYDKYISIETGNRQSIIELTETAKYIKDVCDHAEREYPVPRTQ